MFQLLGTATVFLVIAVVAGLFGFGVLSDEEPLVAKVFCGMFLFLAVAAFGWAWINRSQPIVRAAPSADATGP